MEWLICAVSVHTFWEFPSCLFINNQPAFPGSSTICLCCYRWILNKEFYGSAISGSVSLSPLQSFPLLLRSSHQRMKCSLEMSCLCHVWDEQPSSGAALPDAPASPGDTQGILSLFLKQISKVWNLACEGTAPIQPGSQGCEGYHGRVLNATAQKFL